MKFLSTLLLIGSINLSLAQSPVVIELFTSQGCSSCPAADKNLAEIVESAEKNGQHVYGLSFHVDYWNYIGWKDPYSKKEFTDRQKKYASIMSLEGIYTPQMVINGKHEFVGSDKNASHQEVAKSILEKMEFEISLLDLKQLNGKVILTYSLNKVPVDQIINVALVEKKVGNEVTQGENSGKKLAHRNVVRVFTSLKAQKDGVIEIPATTTISGCQIIVFTQNREWQVTGAANKNF